MTARVYIEVAPNMLPDTPGTEVTREQWAGVGFTFIERFGPRRKHAEMWLVEVKDAGPEFEDCLVDVVIRSSYAAESGQTAWHIDSLEIRS